MQAVLGLLQQGADLIIFDSPPLQAVTDAAVLSSFVDGTLLVDRCGPEPAADRPCWPGRRWHGPVRSTLGAVLNRVPARTPYAYGGYYGDQPEPIESVVREDRMPGAAPVLGPASEVQRPD